MHKQDWTDAVDAGAPGLQSGRRGRFQWFGRLGAPVLAVLVYLFLPDQAGESATLSPAARATAGIATLMATLWISEGLPLPATALLPVLLFPLTGVMSIHAAAAPYAHEFIFLFLGGFMLAKALERWGLHRRIALATVLAVGTSPPRLVAGLMLASAVLSMWISNTATAVMMLPIALGVLRLVREATPAPAAANLGPCLLLGIAYGCSIGGTATLIGTPPNVFLAGFLESQYGVQVGFGRWMLFGVPFAGTFLLATWLLLTRFLFPVGGLPSTSSRQLIRRQLLELGPMSRGERTVMAVFCLTALAWITREPLTQVDWLVSRLPHLPELHDAGIAMAAAILVFALPVDARRGVFVLDWESARELPWGVLLLFGGGLSLAAGFRSTGLDAAIGAPAAHLAGQPFLILLLAVVTVVVFLTEVTSNTATAATFLPIVAGIALGAEADPMRLAVSVALAASCAFMMPVATPPNAIVFGSGEIQMSQMVRAGLVLNGVSILLITLLGMTLVGRMLG